MFEVTIIGAGQLMARHDLSVKLQTNAKKRTAELKEFYQKKFDNAVRNQAKVGNSLNKVTL